MGMLRCCSVRSSKGQNGRQAKRVEVSYVSVVLLVGDDAVELVDGERAIFRCTTA